MIGEAAYYDSSLNAQNKEEFTENSNIPPVLFDTPHGPISRILQNQISARYVKLSFPGYRSFNFLEVQVFDILNTNKALGVTGATASQSSTYNWSGSTFCPASIAVDGITDGGGVCEGLAHSKTENDPWWMVDLGVSIEIDRVVIWNRVNCCAERLSNAAVFLLDGNNNIVGQLPDIGDATGKVTIELDSANFALPSTLSSPSYEPAGSPSTPPSESTTSIPTELPSTTTSPAWKADFICYWDDEREAYYPVCPGNKRSQYCDGSSDCNTFYCLACDAGIQFCSTSVNPCQSSDVPNPTTTTSRALNGLPSTPPSPSYEPVVSPSTPPAPSYEPAGSPSTPPAPSYEPFGLPSTPSAPSYEPAGSPSTPPAPLYEPAGSPSTPPSPLYEPAGSPSTQPTSSSIPLTQSPSNLPAESPASQSSSQPSESTSNQPSQSFSSLPTSQPSEPPTLQLCLPSASKVKIQTLPGQHLQLFDVQVYSSSSGSNLAFGKSAGQSTTLEDGTIASNAIDEDEYSFSLTRNDDPHSWWEGYTLVDMDQRMRFYGATVI
eukprot:scaffold4474_cov66-Cyclotella_meneghiniana.AAC.4